MRIFVENPHWFIDLLPILIKKDEKIDLIEKQGKAAKLAEGWKLTRSLAKERGGTQDAQNERHLSSTYGRTEELFKSKDWSYLHTNESTNANASHPPCSKILVIPKHKKEEYSEIVLKEGKKAPFYREEALEHYTIIGRRAIDACFISSTSRGQKKESCISVIRKYSDKEWRDKVSDHRPVYLTLE